jgi:hypothetical protein
VSNLPIDSLQCNTNDALSNSLFAFNFGGYVTTNQNFMLPVYAYCPGQQGVSYTTYNACGYSQNAITNTINLHYNPLSYSKTADTAVHLNDIFDLVCYAEYDPDMMAQCNYVPTYFWYKDGLQINSFTNTHSLQITSVLDGGYYDIAVVGDCDTNWTSIFVFVDTVNGMQQIEFPQNNISSDGYNLLIRNNETQPITVTIYDALARKIFSIMATIGNSTYQLPHGVKGLMIAEAKGKFKSDYYKILTR